MPTLSSLVKYVTGLFVKAGSSTDWAAAGGVLMSSSTQVSRGTSNGGTGNMISYTVPANTLSVNGQSLRFKAWGRQILAGTSYTVSFGAGTAGFYPSMPAGSWLFEGTILRVSNTVARVEGKVISGPAFWGGSGSIRITSQPAEAITFSNANNFVIFCNDAGASTHGIIDGAILEWLNVP